MTNWNPVVTPEALRHAALSINGATVLGVDGASAKEHRMLPWQGWQQLATLLQRVEANLAWPPQLCTNLVATLFKPTGGEGCVALLPRPVRIHSRLRRALVAGWDAKHAGGCNEAVRKSSALRCSLWRRFTDGSASVLGIACCSIFYDVESFTIACNRHCYSAIFGGCSSRWCYSC